MTTEAGAASPGPCGAGRRLRVTGTQDVNELLRTLADRRSQLVAAWLDALMADYPAEAQGFFQRSADPFRNPVGATLAQAIGVLADGLLAGADPAALRGPLDDIVRIRAVQGLGPATALRFVFELKRVARAALADAGRPEGLDVEEARLDSWVDSLGLLAFELYAAARERIWEIRNRDLTARTYSLLKRAGALEDDVPAGVPSAPGRRPVHLKGGQEE